MTVPRLTYAFALLLCAAPARSQVSVIRSDESRLVLECRFERPAAAPAALFGVPYLSYHIAGCPNGIAPGAPALPTRGIAFAVPPNTAPVIVSASASAETVIVGTPLPAPGIGSDSSVCRLDPGIYSGKARFPAAVAQLAPTVWAGDRKLSAVILHPVRYDPVAHTTTAAARIRVEIEFRPTTAGDRPLPADSKRVLSGLAAARLRGLVNAGSAADWRCLPAMASSSKSTVSCDTLPYKILIARDGWYTVSYEDMERAGVPLSQVDPRTIKLFFQGWEVPVYFRGQQDGTLDPGDRFEFYGRRAKGVNTFFNQFSDANVYWMTWGGLPGARLAEQDGSQVSGDSARCYQALEHWEQDSVFYRLKSPASDQRDRWFWKRIDAPASSSLTLDLADIDISAGTPARFRIMLHGFTDLGMVDHRAVIALNGVTIADTSWSGQTPCLVQAAVPLSAFVAGGNLLTLQHGPLPGVPIDSYFLNWIELKYPRSYQAPGGMLDFAKPDSLHNGAYRFAVTGFPSQNIDVFKLGVSKITGGRVDVGASGLDYTITFSDHSLGTATYVAVIDDSLHKHRPQAIVPNAASDLRNPLHQAEYLIIAPEVLATQARQQAALRATTFRGAMVALTTDIYDEFGQGLAGDQAIKDFISYAYLNYQVPPQYVLLMGGGSYDPRNILGSSKPDYVPVHLSRTDDFGPVPDDDFYVRVVGDDFLADLAIGRLTVNSPADCRGWDTKRAGYEQTPFTDQWHRDFLMIAGFKNYTYETDSIFSAPTEQLCATLNPRFEVSKVYHRNPNTTADLIDQLNEGAVAACYYGHGGGQVWGHSSFFTNAEAEGLNNVGRWPLMGGFTCYSGAIDIPDTLSLCQQLMRVPGGAIGVYASSGPSWDNWIEQTFIGAIDRRMLLRFGDIVTSTELDLFATYGGDSTGYAAQMMRSYNLLGDPGMRLAIPDSDVALSLSPPAAHPGDSVTVGVTGPFPAGSTALFSFADGGGRSLVHTAFATGAGIGTGRWRVPDSAATGQGWAKLYLKNGDDDWAVAVPMSVGRPAFTAYRTLPRRPFDLDSVAVWAAVYNFAGVDSDSVWCDWKFGSAGDTVAGLQQTAMARVAGDTFTVSAKIPPAGSYTAYLNYRVRFVDSGQTYTGPFQRCRIWTRPDLVPSADPRDISLGGTRRLTLFSKVSNRGETDATAVPVFFYRDGAKFDSIVVESIKAGKSVQVAVPYSGGQSPALIALAVDTAHVTAPPEQDTTNNRTAGLLVPANGIEYHQLGISGGSGPVSSFGGGCRWQLPDSCLGDSAVAAVQQITVDQGSPLRPRQQAGLHLVGDSSQYAYAISLTDSSLALRNGRQLTAAVRNPALNSAAARAALYQLDAVGKWNRLPGRIDSAYAGGASPRLGTLLPLASSDSSGPVITASVDRKATGWSDTIKISRPQYSVIIEDPDGVNLDSVRLKKDGQWVPRSAFNLPVNPGDTRTVPLTYAPVLTDGRHQLEILATDNLGNAAHATLVNVVVVSFDLFEVANYPNPVDGDFTTFYFFVGEHADRYELRIFTVAGRHIKTLEGGYSAGIQTFKWDLSDRDDRRVANGVYFYTLKVTQGSRSVTKTGKLAVLR